MSTTPSRNIEENLEEVQQNANVEAEAETPTAQTRDSAPPDDVTCDSCMVSPSRAVKSCLTCMVSYCDVHLRPHLENSRFQSHRLVRPRREVDGQTCDEHRLPLERFCLTDGCCVCLDCENQEHQGHVVSPVGEARAQIEAELRLKQEAIGQSTSAAEKTIKKLQSDLTKSAVQEVCVVVGQQFDRVQAALTEARKEAMEALESRERRAVRQAEGIQAHLEQRRTELMKTLAQINKLLRTKSDVDFLQEYAGWKRGVTDVRPPGVCINRVDQGTSYVRVLTDATQELCDLIRSFYRDKLGLLCKDGHGIRSPMPESHISSLVDPETREEFLTYAKSLTFDPDTTHHFLRATEGNGKLTNTSPWSHGYPDHPDRFEYWRQAMTLHSVYLGRHYIEAELSGEGAHVGVAYRGIDRKGEQSTSCVTGNDFCWCVGRNSRGFFAWHAGRETALDVSDVQRIGLFVDFHRGAVSFYDVTGAMRLLHRYQADLIEPLYVIVWLSKKDNAVSLLNTT